MFRKRAGAHFLHFDIGDFHAAAPVDVLHRAVLPQIIWKGRK